MSHYFFPVIHWKEREILSLFAAFISFTSPSDISSSISQFLTLSHDHFASLLKNATLDSIIAIIMQLNRILQCLLIVLTSPSTDVFDGIPSSLPPEWREQGKHVLSIDLKTWLDSQVRFIRGSVSDGGFRSTYNRTVGRYEANDCWEVW